MLISKPHPPHPFIFIQDAAFLTEVHHVNDRGSDAGVVYCEVQAKENNSNNISYLNMTQHMYPGHCGYKVNLCSWALHTYTHLFTTMHTHSRTHTQHTHTHTHLFTPMHTHSCKHTHTYSHPCTHTHAHTHSCTSYCY